MTKWYRVAPPHEDIRAGDFDESVFAAKLGDVVDGSAPPDYSDPYAFYKKTYLTAGLEKLLERIYSKLDNGRGPGVVQLQTPFGGGKTHALILAYHYLAHGERIEELLPDDVGLLTPNIATIVGTDVNPSTGFRDGNIHRRTLWGEIVYQLGGGQAYTSIQKNDEDRVSPGRKALQEVLEPLQPFTILLDELLEYVVRARGLDYAGRGAEDADAVKVGTTTLGAQTLSFFQELTEAVSNIEHGMLIATLPSSEQEDFGEAEQGNLAKIEKIFGRLEAIYTPVQGREVYSIIRRRLFERPDEGKVREIVDRYISTYQNHKNALPGKATSVEMREKMELAYPFHPDIIDILYEKWSTFSSFQRTRGALRLLARVAEDLFEREEAIDLILPGDINLNQPAIRQEFLRHVGNEYEGVIGSDIAGSNAKAMQLDQENHAWDHLAQRNATAIFLHSFAADDSDRGIQPPYIKLDVARPDTTFPLVTEVLQQMKQDLWYLNTRGEQEYYFSNVPNLNRMVIDKKSQVQSRAVRKELKRRIENELGTKLDCYLWPRDGDAIPDTQSLKLVVLDPAESYTDTQLRHWVEKSGQSYRAYKNTIFFAKPDPDRYARFQDAIKQYLALQDILDGIEQGEHPALEAKTDEVRKRRDALQDDFSIKVRELYQQALVPVLNGSSLEKIDFGRPPVGSENLDSWFRKKLSGTQHGKILAGPPSPTFIQNKFLSNSDTIAIQAVLEQFYKNPNLPALDTPTLIAEAIVNGVREGQYGLAQMIDEEVKPASVRINEVLSPTQVPFQEEGWVLVTDEKASELQARVTPAPNDRTTDAGRYRNASSTGRTSSTEPASSSTESSSADSTADASPSDTSESTASAQEETVHTLSLRASGLPSGKIYDLNQGVLKPLTAKAGAFEFTIEFEVSSEDGIPTKTIEQTVIETLRQLGATIERKEME